MRFIFIGLSLLFLSGCTTIYTQDPAPYSHFGSKPGAGSAGVHTVSTGDTLYSIAKRYRLTMPDVIYLNKMRPPYALDIGQRVSLPPPNEYKVSGGDTLYSISRMFDVSITDIARQNRIRSPYTIQEGDVLRLPSVRPGQGGATYQTASYSSQKQVGVAKRGAARLPSNIQRKPKYTPRKVTKAPPKRGGKSFLWPTDGKVLSSYGPKDGGLHNDGINIKAPRGSTVKAAEHGVVVYSGSELKGYGNLVLVKHSDRWMTAYAHLDKVIAKRGSTIKRGQKLGTVGTSGGVDSPQLHFEIRRGTQALNPQYYLAQRGS